MGPPQSDPSKNSEQNIFADTEESANLEKTLQEEREAELVNHLCKLQIFSDCEFVKDGGKVAELVNHLYELQIYSDCEFAKDGRKGMQDNCKVGKTQVPTTCAGSQGDIHQNSEVIRPQLLHSSAGCLGNLHNNFDVYEVYMLIPNESGVKGLYKAHVLVQRKDLRDCGEGDNQFLDVKEIRIYGADEDPAENEEAFEIQLATGNDPESPTAFIRYIKAPRPKARMQKYRSGRFCRKRKIDAGVPRPPKRMCAPEYESDHGSRTKPGQNANEGI